MRAVRACLQVLCEALCATISSDPCAVPSISAQQRVDSNGATRQVQSPHTDTPTPPLSTLRAPFHLPCRCRRSFQRVVGQHEVVLHIALRSRTEAAPLSLLPSRASVSVHTLVSSLRGHCPSTTVLLLHHRSTLTLRQQRSSPRCLLLSSPCHLTAQ